VDKNLNLADYWIKSPPLLLAIILMAVALVGALLGSQSDDTESQEIIGTTLGVEERTRDEETVRLLLIELDDGPEVYVTLPARVESKIGERVKVIKTKSSYPGSSSFKYKFEKYAN